MLLTLVLLFVGLHMLFACAYLLLGGMQGLESGSYWQAFLCSVRTGGTAACAPVTSTAHALAVAESFVGLLQDLRPLHASLDGTAWPQFASLDLQPINGGLTAAAGFRF